MKKFTFLMLFFISLSVSGQQYPPPITLPIQNIPQQTQVWCWAAVAQQIILASQGPANTPPQCALVAMANGANPSVCCSEARNPACVTAGSLQQIQYLIGRFGGQFSTDSSTSKSNGFIQYSGIWPTNNFTSTNRAKLRTCSCSHRNVFRAGWIWGSNADLAYK